MTTPEGVDPNAPTNGPPGERRPNGRWILCPHCGRGISARQSADGATWSTYRHDRGGDRPRPQVDRFDPIQNRPRFVTYTGTPLRGVCEGVQGASYAETRPNSETRPLEAPRYNQPPPSPQPERNVRRPRQLGVAVDEVFRTGGGASRQGTSGREYEEALRQRWHAEHPPPPPPVLGPEMSPEFARARRDAARAAEREREAQERAAAVVPPAELLAELRAAARAAARKGRISRY